MRHILLSVTLLLCLVFTGCNKDETKPIRDPKQFNLPAKASEVIAKSNGFGIDLFRKTASVENGNIMLSPLSASAALTMLLNGCENSTYSQIQQMLGFQGMTIAEINETYKSLVSQLLDADSEVKLAIANAIWYRNDFQVKPPFLTTMSSDFSAHIEALDFSLPSTLNTMNKWASDNTYGKIPKVLNEISPDAVMFLMNALYFKGIWSNQFEKSKTFPKAFNTDDGSSINVNMMHGKINAFVKYDQNYSAIELCYGRKNYSMLIVVPTGKLSDFCNNFSMEDWNSLTNSFSTIEVPTGWDVSVPRFKFSYEKVLNDQLIGLGMVDAFSSELADLTGISDADIFVSFVKQNTFVEVNEEGTEAAAVTTIGIELTSLPPSTPSFVVDKPFIFAIRERTTNTILFIGKVVNPSL